MNLLFHFYLKEKKNIGLELNYICKVILKAILLLEINQIYNMFKRKIQMLLWISVEIYMKGIKIPRQIFVVIAMRRLYH